MEFGIQRVSNRTGIQITEVGYFQCIDIGNQSIPSVGNQITEMDVGSDQRLSRQ